MYSYEATASDELDIVEHEALSVVQGGAVPDEDWVRVTNAEGKELPQSTPIPFSKV
jgi:hypothetical protein